MILVITYLYQLCVLSKSLLELYFQNDKRLSAGWSSIQSLCLLYQLVLVGIEVEQVIVLSCVRPAEEEQREGWITRYAVLQ